MTAHNHHHNHNQVDQLFVDPVCGMSTADRDDFISHVHGGETYYFCSAHCRESFRSDPDTFADNESVPSLSGKSSHASGTLYTCPMHSEVEQEGPGSCPKCGMSLEPVTPIGSKVTYTCPMHPEIVQDVLLGNPRLMEDFSIAVDELGAKAEVM